MKDDRIKIQSVKLKHKGTSNYQILTTHRIRPFRFCPDIDIIFVETVLGYKRMTVTVRWRVNNALAACLRRRRRRHFVLAEDRVHVRTGPSLCPCDRCRSSDRHHTLARYATSSPRATTVTSVRVTASGCRLTREKAISVATVPLPRPKTDTNVFVIRWGASRDVAARPIFTVVCLVLVNFFPRLISRRDTSRLRARVSTRENDIPYVHSGQDGNDFV